MATYYHWVGATANSVDKYDWNIASNWIVQSTGINTTTASSTPYSRATRYPIAGDTVVIGETFHCLSPLLFGGFSGSTGHSAGDWGSGYTTGATAGGVNLTVHTDILAASSPTTFSILFGVLRNPACNCVYTGLAEGEYWGQTGSWSKDITDENFIHLLREANPHAPSGTWNRLTGFETAGQPHEMAFYGSYDHVCHTNTNPGVCVHVDGEYGPKATKYPFPFLGGGLTGKALQWALGQHRKSYYGYGLGKGKTADDAWLASRSDAVNAAAFRNAWIGGGITGSAAALAGTANRAANTPLRLRVQSLRFLTPQGGESINNPLYADIDLVGDKAADGTIASTVYINQPKASNHAFRLEGGTIRSLDILGDSSVDVVGMTAATVNSEYSSYMRSDSTSRFGGLRIKSISMGRDRYNTWSGFHMAGITSGARYAVWGAQATAANKDANASKLILEQPNPYNFDGATLGTALGNQRVGSTMFLNPMFAIGVVDGTTGQTGGAATIPTMECNSGADLGSVWQIHYSGPSLITLINDSGSNHVVASPLASKTNSVQIGTLNGSNGTIVDFRANPNVDNIYFGGTTGSGNSMRIIGGLVSTDDTVSIIPSKGCAFINTKSVDGVIDGRTSHKTGASVFSIDRESADPLFPPTANNQ